MQIGDEFGPYTVTVSREQLVRYAGAADDYNPIHYDDAAAQSFGLPGVIVHGMLNMGIIARVMAEHWPSGTEMSSFQVRFRQMVQPGERLEIRGRVTSVDGCWAGVDVELGRAGDKPAISGRMKIRIASA
jgi:acyl dehydratase